MFDLRKKALLLMLVVAWGGLGAQIPSGYYNAATGKTGDELKVALHNIIKGHHVVSYGGLLNAFAYTDCKPNGKIWDIYSNIEYSLNTGLCGEYVQEGDCWNREHTWPQSWFGDQTAPRSDLFHVYPTDGYVNARRGNYPYGEVKKVTYTSGNGSKLGSCLTTGYSGTVFEPIDEYKGDIARTYFYMSVRYFGEDDSWGTSGMTDKSEIKNWAMTMLLRWSDEDPVSQKEIDRNNAVYGYQNNRNPFIDHPEYARMIWDENWSGGISHNITCATGLSHGSISAPETALEGSTVAIIATPDPGYMVDTYTVYKTNSPTTTVTVSSNGTFTMPSYDVTVSATFKPNSTIYHITLGTVSHGSISTSTNSALSGTTITLTATPESGYVLYSWYVYKVGDMGTTVPVSGNSFTMPAFNVTVMATFVQGSANNGDYAKMATAPTDWSGEYVLLYENSATSAYVWTGIDAVNSYEEKTIANASVSGEGLVSLTIAPMDGGYSIRVNGGTNNGKYIYGTADNNKLNFSNNPMANTLAFGTNGVTITSNTSVMRFNNNDKRFRYYKSTTYNQQQPVQLYRKVSYSVPIRTIHFDPNGGTGWMDDQNVDEYEPVELQTNAFDREGFVFDGWNTEAEGAGEYYADGATIRLLADLDLYAQWDQLFDITVVEASHGSITVSATQAIEETTISLTASPEPCFALDHWTVTDAQGNPVTVIEDQFEMPASDVTVSAVFNYAPQLFEQTYYLVTSAEQLVAGRTYLIVNVDNGMALGTTQNSNNRSAASVTIEDNVIAAIDNTICELTLGSENGYWTFFDPQWGNQGGYLYAASSSNNYLRTQATNNDNGRWNISFGSNGVATMVAQGANSRNMLKYNKSNAVFSCYPSNNVMQDVYLFRRSEIFDYPAEQTDDLTTEWTWWSTYLDISLAELETAMGNNGLHIVSQYGSASYLPGYGWDGSLTTLEPAKMYMIEISAPFTLTLEGLPVNTAHHPVTLVPGYSWIGYPLAHSMSINEALAGLTPNIGDVIKSQNGMAMYTGISWQGTLTALEPGKGYIYKSNATSNKTFCFPSN